MYLIAYFLVPICMMTYSIRPTNNTWSITYNGKMAAATLLVCFIFFKLYKANYKLPLEYLNLHKSSNKKLFYFLILIFIFSLFGFSYTFVENKKVYLIGYDENIILNLFIMLLCVLAWNVSKYLGFLKRLKVSDFDKM